MIIAADPLFNDPFGWSEVGVVLLKVVVAFVFLLVAVMFNIWFLRKVISDMQNRIGPNLAGPWGILVTLADGIKLFFKEDLIPEKSHRFVFKMAPYLSLIPAFLVFAIVPIGGDFNRIDGPDGVISIFGHQTLLQVADPPVGILFFLAMSSLAVYGVMLAGWGSGSKYPLLGFSTSFAQMVSYEAALGLSIASVVLVSGTLSMHEMVLVQAGQGFNSFLPNWNIIVTGFHPFLCFLVAGPQNSTIHLLIWSKPNKNSSAAFIPSTRRSALHCSICGIHESDNYGCDYRHALLGGTRGSGTVRAEGLVDWHFLVLLQIDALLVRVRVVARHAASAPLRPTHGPRLEVADSFVACVVLGSGRHPDRS